MSFVVDASIVAAWLLPDESNELAERARLAMTSEDALAPDLLLHEIRNILIVSERRNRVTADSATRLLAGLRRVPLILVEMKDDRGILQLAREHRLSGYDATYLALAVAHNTALVILDRKLDAAARVAGLKTFD